MRERQKKQMNHSLQVTLPSAYMQVRVMTQLLFEAFDAWICVDNHKA